MDSTSGHWVNLHELAFKPPFNCRNASAACGNVVMAEVTGRRYKHR
jgi:hypothetical protein